MPKPQRRACANLYRSPACPTIRKGRDRYGRVLISVRTDNGDDIAATDGRKRLRSSLMPVAIMTRMNGANEGVISGSPRPILNKQL